MGCNVVGVGWGGVDYVLHGVECCSSVEYCMCGLLLVWRHYMDLIGPMAM